MVKADLNKKIINLAKRLHDKATVLFAEEIVTPENVFLLLDDAVSETSRITEQYFIKKYKTGSFKDAKLPLKE